MTINCYICENRSSPRCMSCFNGNLFAPSYRYIDTDIAAQCNVESLYPTLTIETCYSTKKKDIVEAFENAIKACGGKATMKKYFEIKKVIFNDPATVVLWEDGTKTVVKAGEDDIYDPEKGLAMAIAKKALGNQGNYYEVFKKWLSEEEETDMTDFQKSLAKLGEEILKSLKAGAFGIKSSSNKEKPLVTDVMVEESNPKTCGNCDKTDALCYASNPPKVKCTLTGDFHWYDDICNVKEGQK